MEIPGVPEGPDWVSLRLGGPTIVRTQRERRREGSECSVDRGHLEKGWRQVQSVRVHGENLAPEQLSVKLSEMGVTL